MRQKCSNQPCDFYASRKGYCSACYIRCRYCMVCKCKLRLSGFKCRCDQMFCRVHRLPFDHVCTFDYRAMTIGTLTQQNPIVISDKVNDRI